jgi:hypothetical protein
MTEDHYCLTRVLAPKGRGEATSTMIYIDLIRQIAGRSRGATALLPMLPHDLSYHHGTVSRFGFFT